MLYLFIQNYFDVPVVPSINSKSNYPDDDLTPALIRHLHHLSIARIKSLYLPKLISLVAFEATSYICNETKNSSPLLVFKRFDRRVQILVKH
jgi:hypothetical protein